MERALDNVELSRVVSDILARLQAVEQRRAAVPQPSQGASSRLYYLPSPVLVFSGTTTAVSNWTPAGVNRTLPAGATTALLQVHTRSGDDAILVYLSPDGRSYSLVGSADRSTGDEVDVWEHALVPLSTAGDFFYQVIGDPGTTNWKAFDCYLVGYWA